MDNSVQPDPSQAQASLPEFNPDLRGVSLDDLYHQALKLHHHKALPNAELNKVATALAQVQEILNEHNNDQFIVRQARLSDIDSLDNMVRYWAQQGENLPRPREDLIRNIQSFAVCAKNGQVMGCACLYVYDTGLAEIRSLGVNPMVQRQGQGRAIVEYLLYKAESYEIKKVFVLTRNPQFFAKVGFTQTTIEALPEKIRKDCDNCPKRERCDEVAYEYNFSPERSLMARHVAQLGRVGPLGTQLGAQLGAPEGTAPTGGQPAAPAGAAQPGTIAVKSV